MNKQRAFAPDTQRIPMAGENEYDVLTRLHHTVDYKPGERKIVKRKYHRRWRKMSRVWARSVALPLGGE